MILCMIFHYMFVYSEHNFFSDGLRVNKLYSLSLHIMVSEPADFPKSGLWSAGSFIVTHVETTYVTQNEVL